MWYLITYVFGGITYTLSTTEYITAKEMCITLQGMKIQDIHMYKVAGEIRWRGMEVPKEE